MKTIIALSVFLVANLAAVERAKFYEAIISSIKSRMGVEKVFVWNRVAQSPAESSKLLREDSQGVSTVHLAEKRGRCRLSGSIERPALIFYQHVPASPFAGQPPPEPGLGRTA